MKREIPRDADGNRLCEHCLVNPVPPSLGTKPRSYCSRNCRQRAYEARRTGKAIREAVAAATRPATSRDVPPPAEAGPATSREVAIPPARGGDEERAEVFALGAQVVLLVPQRGSATVHGRRVVYDLPVGVAGTVAEVGPGPLLVEWDTGVRVPVDARALHPLRPRPGRAARGE